MQVHIARNGQALGPFSIEEINRQLADGRLSPSDLAWYEGAPGWVALSTVPGVTVRETAGSPPVPKSPVATQPVTSVPAGSPVPVGKTEPLAVFSLILSVLGLFCCGLFSGIPGIICGHLALSKIEKNPGLEGHGLAVAGLVIGYFASLAWLFWLLFFGGISVLQGILQQMPR